MDPAKRLKEFELVLARAKRAGVTVLHYPDNGVAVLRLPIEKPVAATDTPPAGSPPTTPPAAQ